MIIHLFNSSSVSGPERLVLPALANFSAQFLIVNLREARIGTLRDADPLEAYCRSLKLPYRGIQVEKRVDRQAIARLQQLLEELKPELVHVHGMKSSIYLIEAGKTSARRFPILSTHHGVHGLPDLKTRFYEWLYRKRYLPFFDRIIAVSTADYEFLADSGTAKAKLRLHLNGMNARLVRPEDRAHEAQRIRALWLPQEPDRDRLFLFGVVGRLSAEKDHARIWRVLSALNRLPCDRAWRCLIFGVGALESKLRAEASRLGLDKRIIWMGYRQGVGDELAGLDLILSFSKAEGLPINLVEAGWAGTAVMSTYVGGVKDLIPDESYGVAVPPEEAVQTSANRMQSLLLKDAGARLLALGAHFQERVKREFSQEKWLRRLEELYGELNVKFNN